MAQVTLSWLKSWSEEVERMCTGNIMSDSVVTANEAGGWHRGRPVVFTASEDEDHIAFNNDHVKQDMNDGPNENEKTEAESKRVESTYSETTPSVAVETAEVTGEEHPDRGTVNDDAENVETAKEAGGRHRGRPVLRTVNEDDDFIVFHNDLVEQDTDDVLDENFFFKKKKTNGISGN